MYVVEKRIARIMQMEQYFDIVREKINQREIDFYEDAEILRMIQSLNEYQKSGQWLIDFASDERGELPSDLKRGVLSEDGLYNLLNEVECLSTGELL